VLDTKNKGSSNCNCPDCKKKTHFNQLQSKLQPLSVSSNKKEKNSKKKNTEMKKVNSNTKKSSNHEKVDKTLHELSDKPLESFKISKSENSNDSNKSKNPSSEHLMDTLIDTNKTYTMWIEVKKRLNTKVVNRNYRSSSEHSSHDYGYSSEYNISSSSLQSTPEGSEAACSDSCCNHEGECLDLKPTEKCIQSDSNFCILKKHGEGLTLSQMLEVNLSKFIIYNLSIKYLNCVNYVLGNIIF
jgi:hypothetical protein